MSAKHALLGLLLHRPAYRYQLGDRLQERLGPAWKINSGQLYQTIKQLAADGLIERIDGAADDQDERHVFAITMAGAEEFERWFEEARERGSAAAPPAAGQDHARRPRAPEGRARGRSMSMSIDCAAAPARAPVRERRDPGRGCRCAPIDELLRLNLSADIAQLEGELGWARYARERVSWLLS